MKDLAQTDERARVFNRRYAVNFLSNAEANQRRNQLPYCVCICDLDKFIDGDRLLSASSGIAEARGEDDIGDMVVLADKALYKAKAGGWGRAIYFTE